MMNYSEQSTLMQRGPVEQMEDIEVEVFLRGDRTIAIWDEGHQQAGHDECLLFPAFAKGGRCWLLSRRWHAGGGYSASGTEEEILTFEEGVKLLCEKGCWSAFPFEEAFPREKASDEGR